MCRTCEDGKVAHSQRWVFEHPISPISIQMHLGQLAVRAPETSKATLQKEVNLTLL